MFWLLAAKHPTKNAFSWQCPINNINSLIANNYRTSESAETAKGISKRAMDTKYYVGWFTCSFLCNLQKHVTEIQLLLQPVSAACLAFSGFPC